MCGICGKLIFDPAGEVPVGIVDAMTRMLAHRGPDGAGRFHDRRIGLGHRRLSIVDVAEGAQPMHSSDGTLTVVFNGEIYNHPELKSRFEADGITYRTRCDTESILHAYARYGRDCVYHLEGMFAFALWDHREQALFCARDRFGIKPFYYHLTGDAFSFASELKALFVDETCDDTLDPIALYDYFTFKYVPGPRTPFKAIRQLPPAHTVWIRDGQAAISRYWTPTPHTGTADMPAGPEERLEALEAHLIRAIAAHRMSDVPQGLFLSGGVDSTLIALLMRAATNEPVHSYSMSFPGFGSFDEGQYAAEAAKAAGTEHQVFECPPTIADDLQTALWHIESPLADAAMLPLLALCRAARNAVTVIHCGDGGDEAFGGYTRFYWDQFAGGVARVPGAIRRAGFLPAARALQALPGRWAELGRRVEKFTRFADLPPATRYAQWFTFFPNDLKHGVLHRDLLAQVAEHRSGAVFEALFADAAAAGWKGLAQQQYTELHSFVPDDLMLKSDKVAMACGLEGRFPLLDHRIVEFGLSMPAREKVDRRTLKKPLRALLHRHMPPAFVNRPKQGFEVPVSDWLRGPWRDRMMDSLGPTALKDDDLLDADGVGQLLTAFDRGDPAAGRRLFVLFAFQQWRRVCTPIRPAVRRHLAATPA